MGLLKVTNALEEKVSSDYYLLLRVRIFLRISTNNSMHVHVLKQYIKIKNKFKSLHGGFDWNRISRSCVQSV
jgi:hypothetical protein